MRIAVQTLLACAALTVTPRATFAQANAPATADQTQTDRTGDATAAPAQPNNAPDASGVQQQATPSGQWVYTEQYGWLWMPYGSAYLHAPADSYGDPSMYVYGPTLGWVWVDAPWVWGWGPSPYFGFYGPWRFAWYGHGYWGHGWGGFRGYGPYAWRGGAWGWRGGGWRGGGWRGGWHGGAVPAPSRAFHAPARAGGAHHR